MIIRGSPLPVIGLIEGGKDRASVTEEAATDDNYNDDKCVKIFTKV